MSFSFIWDMDAIVDINQHWLKCVARELPSKTRLAEILLWSR
jgi:hypothetical protein